MTCLVFLLGTNLQLASRLDKETVTVRAGHRGLLRNSLQKGRDVAARYTATGLARPEDLRALQEGEAQPLSLASGDFNLDGFPDLARGSASSGAGLVTLHLGNPEAFAPSPLTIQALVNGQSPDSFLTDAIVLRTPEAPEFLATGDFDRDGRLDILTGARGSAAMYLLAGDGNHGFHEPTAVPLPGQLTTMVAGQKTRMDEWTDVVVGFAGEKGPALAVYETSQGVLAESPVVYPLPDAASEVALGRLDEDHWADLAIVAGHRLLVLHGWDDEAADEPTLEDEEEGGYLEPIALPFGVTAVALSDFIWDRDARMELAVAGDDGSVRILAHGLLDTRPVLAEEVLARRRIVDAVRRGERPQSDLAPATPFRALTWQVADTIAAPSWRRSGGPRPLLVSTLGSGQQAHDLLILDSGTTVAALPMRVSVHGLPGLVVLRQGDSEPLVQGPLSHVAFNVNTAADTDDATVGNGACADSGGNCSLRAAVQEANAHAGADIITFSSALNGVPIQLTQAGDDNTAAQGDLDINSDMTIVGNGAANTIIQGSSNAAFMGNMGDKIFGINQNGTSSTLSVSISGLTVRFTRNSNPVTGTFTDTGGALDVFLAGTGAMPEPTTTITNCTFDSNANLNSYGGAINIDSGDLMGGTNIFRGTVQITGNTISNNDTLNAGAGAQAFGGGVNLFADRHNVTFTSTTITGNQTSANVGSHGGGLNIHHRFGGTVTLSTSTISNNTSGSDGGGIMIAVLGSQTVNMTSGSISGNTAQGTGGDADGGGLFNGNPAGGTTLSGVTINNNTATAGANARGGGIHDGANAPLTINNCVITGNASDNGGGVATTNAFVNQLTTITNCTISGNSATVAGGALFVSSGTMTANLNRIVNNTAPAGSGIAQTGGTASVENNWWQCDGFPNAPGCQTGSGMFDADPRIDLRVLPTSATLALGGTQTFTANVSQNTNGAAINPVVLNGLTTMFNGGALGSVVPGSSALSNLLAATLFTASSTCPVPNTGNISAMLDGGTQTSSMTVQVPPAISACPANQTVNTDPAMCTASVSFTPPTATAGCPAPTVTCRIGATPITSPRAFPVGTSTVTCTASNGVAPDASCSFTVTVNDMENPSIVCPANITVTENPPGSSAAVVTYTAPVGTDACPGATTVQTAGQASGTAFPLGVTTNTFRVTDAAGNTATCSFNATVVLPTDLTVTKSHTGDFTQGQTGASYTITASNTGGSQSSGTVTLTDSVPSGLVATAAAGPGWTCNVSPSLLTCTRSDALAQGTSYPPVILTVNVASNAPGSVTNTATVGGGGDVNTTNNTAMDVTTIIPGPDLTVTKSHTGNFVQGQSGAQFTVTVTNSGGTPTSGTITLADSIPPGLVPTAASGTGWTCGIAGAMVNCSRSDALAPSASYPAVTITVNVEPTAPPSVINTANTAGGGELNTANNTAMDSVTITSGPDLRVSKSHAGSFLQGQVGAQFTVIVTNSGGSPTSGVVTLMDNLPAGLTPTAASGTGWACGVAGVAVNCSRSDALGVGVSYGAVTITVNVAPNAPPSVTNTATISGGADVSNTNNTATDVATVVPCMIAVTTMGDSGPGSLRDAIGGVCPGGTITFDPATFAPAGGPYTIALASELAISKSLTITGPTNTVVTVEGNDTFRLMDISGTAVDVAISHLSLTRGGPQAGTNAAAIEFNGAGTLTLSDCDVHGNVGPISAVYANQSTGISVQRCTFRDNSFFAFFVDRTPLTLVNSTVSNSFGSGIYTSASGTLITQSTIVGNSIGIQVHDGCNGCSSATVTNTLLSGNGTNLSKSGVATLTSGGHNLLDDGSAAAFDGPVDPTNVIVAPGAAGLAPIALNGGRNRTHALLAGSPALDAGNNAAATAEGLMTDQRGAGFERIRDAADVDTTQTVDIGAFEADPMIEDIGDQTTPEDTPLAIAVNLGDAATPFDSIAATSDNPALVPDTNLTIGPGGSASTRLLSIVPAADASGTATITVTVTKTVNGMVVTASDTFVLDVTEVNDAPLAVGDTLASVLEDSGPRTIPFTALLANDAAGPAGESGQALVVKAVGGAVGGTVALTATEILFTPAAGFNGTASFTYTVEDNGTTSGAPNPLTSAPAGVSFTMTAVADTPSITNATTTVNTQTTSGLVITRNAVDGAEVTHVKVTGITNGTLFLADGTTPVATNSFITMAQGAAGLRFTPAANLSSPGSSFGFDVQASIGATDAGLGGALVHATVTASKLPTTVVVSTSASSPPFGQPVTFTATISPTAATGTVQFTDGAANLGAPAPVAGGQASFTSSTLTPGPHAVTAVYSGDALYVAATSPVFTQTIACQTITVGPATLPPGKRNVAYAPVTFTQTGGTGAVSFSLVGTLPAGMTLTNAVLGGTPTVNGTFPISIVATDVNGCTGTQAYTLVIELGPPTLTITTGGGAPNQSATTSFFQIEGTAADDGGVVKVTWTSDRGFAGEATVTAADPADSAAGATAAPTSATWAAEVPLLGGANVLTFTAVDTDDLSTPVQVIVTVSTFTYYLAEGVTGPFFDTYLLLGNATATPAPVTITFYPESGAPLTVFTTVGPTSRVTLPVDALAGMANRSFATRVVSTDAVPLAVERSTYWDAQYLGGHAAMAADLPRTRWTFAEGTTQGLVSPGGPVPFFDTYLLLGNPGPTPAAVTIRYLREIGGVVTQTLTLAPAARTTIHANAVAGLANAAFGIEVTSDVGIVAARSVYFADYRGGASSEGVPAASSWVLAEAPTGPFFESFLLLSNANGTPAPVTVIYYPESGAPVTKLKTIPANGRLTVSVAGEDPALATTTVWIRVNAPMPIAAERTVFWANGSGTWVESHASSGASQAAAHWALAEGAVGGPLGFETYLIFANPSAADATVQVTYLRENGTTLLKTYTVNALQRRVVFVNGQVPELANEGFAIDVRSTNGVPIVAERSMYWHGLGGGTSVTGKRVPD